MSRTSHINLPVLYAISAEKTQDLRLISPPAFRHGDIRRFSDKTSCIMRRGGSKTRLYTCIDFNAFEEF